MVWDTSTPIGTESKSQGDDRIRELKTDVQTALRGNAASGTEAVFPGADTSNPVFRYRGLKGTTGARPAAGDYGLYINETLNTIQRDNGSAWVDVATLIPSGTVMVFYQAAAPTGWTKLTTQNDKALRVVSAAGGGSGGSHSLSAGVSHSHTVTSHTHDLGNHTHSTPAHTHTLADGVGSAQGDSGTETIKSTAGNINTGNGAGGTRPIVSYTTDSGGSGTSGAPSSNSSGAAAPGTDTQAPVIAYIDVIICSKD